MGVAGLVMTGCGSSGSGPDGAGEVLSRPATSETIYRVTADWDDVEAALFVAIPHAEMAALSSTKSDNTVETRLRTVKGLPGWVRVTRVGTGPDPVMIEVTCSIGPTGDKPAQRRLVLAIVNRLTQLRGVETAPVRW